MLSLCAFLANAAMVVFAAWLTLKHGLPNRGEDILLCAAMLGVPLLNLAVMFRLRQSPSRASLLGLFIERLRLEQERRIAELKKGNGI